MLIAPDKFRDSLTAAEAAQAIATGVTDAMPTAAIVTTHIADGGEGSLATCFGAGLHPAPDTTLSPLGGTLTARYARRDDTAVTQLIANIPDRHDNERPQP